MPLVSTRRNFLLGVAAVATPLPALGQAPPPPRAVHARPGKAQLLAPPAPATPILGFEGATPGPLLRYKLGDTLAVKLVNETDAHNRSHPSARSWRDGHDRGNSHCRGAGVFVKAVPSAGEGLARHQSVSP